MQQELRSEVETSTSLLDIYNLVNRRLAAVPAEERRELRLDPRTQAFRAQLGDSLHALTIPRLELNIKRALCTIVDQCVDEEEELQLCSAILQHIGGEVEMYVRAVGVDPDQRRYLSLSLGDEPSQAS